jgi:hypothetical protein
MCSPEDDLLYPPSCFLTSVPRSMEVASGPMDCSWVGPRWRRCAQPRIARGIRLRARPSLPAVACRRPFIPTWGGGTSTCLLVSWQPIPHPRGDARRRWPSVVLQAAASLLPRSIWNPKALLKVGGVRGEAIILTKHPAAPPGVAQVVWRGWGAIVSRAGHTPLQVIALCIAIAAKRLPTRDLLRQIIRGKPRHT